MRQILNFLTWGFLILFAAPTIMIIASWNSLPGNPLYGIKLGMEQALLVLVSPSFAAQGTLSVKYTERRFSESKQLLASKGSVEGLAYLDKQVVATKDVIVHGNDSQTQQELAQTYIDKLKDVSAELETQKQAIAAAPPTGGGALAPTPIVQLPTATPTIPQAPTRVPFVPLQPPSISPYAVPTPIPTRPPPPPPAAPPPAPQQQQQNAISQITQSQQTIDDTIKQLEGLKTRKEREEKPSEQNQPNRPESQREKVKGKE